MIIFIMALFGALLTIAVIVRAEEIAGGMIYTTSKDTGLQEHDLLRYLGGNEEVQANVLEKNKEYYIASLNKISVRLELAKVRVSGAQLPDADRSMLNSRIDSGLMWLDEHKRKLSAVSMAEEFAAATPQNFYRQLHVIKMIPRTSEGYAITVCMQRNIESVRAGMNVSGDAARALSEAGERNRHAMGMFLDLLSLDERSDLNAAEKKMNDAFSEAAKADSLISKASGNARIP